MAAEPSSTLAADAAPLSDRLEPWSAGELAEPSAPTAWQRRLAGGAFWVLVGRGLGMGVTLVSQVALTRLLSPDDFGRWVLLSSVVAFASTLAMLGLGSALLKQLAASAAVGEAGCARRQLRRGWIVALTSTAILAAILPWVLALVPFGVPQTAVVLGLAVGNLALLTWQQLLAECLRGLHEQRWANLLTGGAWGGPAQNLVMLVLLLSAAAFTTPSLELLLALNLLAFVCTLPAGVVALGNAWKSAFPVEGAAAGGEQPPAASDSLGELLRLCVPLMLVQLMVFLTVQADLWLAGWYCASGDVALYGAARRGMMLVFAPLQLAHLAVVAHIAQLHALDRRQELERMLRWVATLAAVPSTLVSLVLLVAGGAILALLCGPFYRDAAGVLAVMVLGQMVYVWGGASDLTLNMTGHQRVSLAVHVVSVLALLGLGALVGPRYGILGLAWTSTGVVVLRTLADWWLVRRLLGVWTHTQLIPQWSIQPR